MCVQAEQLEPVEMYHCQQTAEAVEKMCITSMPRPNTMRGMHAN